MFNRTRTCHSLASLLVAATAPLAGADVITDWNTRANEFIVEAKMGTPPAVRLMAMVQTAVDESVGEITRVSTTGVKAGEPLPNADAAVAAARDAGIAIGERPAAAVLAARATDGAAAPEWYRPHTTPGAYVPTVIPAVPQWASRKAWLIDSPARFRPGPPPATYSDLWARDFNEVKTLGGRNSTARSAEQTEIARFWELSLPAIYHRLLRSVADVPGRDLTTNARLYAVVAQAMDDALISVMDAKYHYNFWRPITAGRNGDIDGHDGTERDPAWRPLIDTPSHPEYACAHCILAAAVGTMLKEQLDVLPGVVLSTSSPTARDTTRRWHSVEDPMREVANARIYDGVHYRNSTERGLDMGRRIGEPAAARLQQAAE
ncbi:MAG TPA: vanadium-dependent haloperoxidase [Accumulibacter sp.]|nr:vanadium-dependent haloperoxidase [Accumulibacter sp.]